jgi:long-chain acyl-CoA synthetase
MRRETLLDFFADIAKLDGPFLVHDDGYRVREYSYAHTGRLAHAFAARLRGQGVRHGDALVIWSENRPEWIVALWGALLEGVVVVPIDFRVSADFLWRVQQKTDARVVLVGDDVTLEARAGVATWKIRELGSDEPAAGPSDPDPPRDGQLQQVTAGHTAEIIFTSGATAEPKGVVITHRNILANIVPVEREILKYRKYARPFLPIRFLNLLPLSHMFGQAMATFIPPVLSGVVVFSHSYNPQEIVRQVRGRRISVLVCVPKLLEVLRDHVARVVPEAATPYEGRMHWLRRWWVYRRVHRLFGWKFWAFIVGAAPLDPALEAFWTRLGFGVIQGYGLTETAPIVTLNHPLKARRGTVGSPIPGVEVRIADDGEILVRGDNVTQGYFKAPEETAAAFADGWLHTGDIGEMDSSGRLTIRGRKKEMIVTPEGLNVFPEDVERAVEAQPGVRESAVVGVSAGGTGNERVHAVLVLDEGTDAEATVRGANGRLEDHQRIRSYSVWPGETLPRTEGTRKLRRRDLHRWVTEGQGAAPEPATGDRPADAAAVVASFARQRTVGPDTTIEELGLSSLERVELMMALEEAFDTTIDEGRFAVARTVGDLEALARGRDAEAVTRTGAQVPTSVGRRPASGAAFEFPRWNRAWWARTIRRASLPTWILPTAGLFARTRVEGLEHLDALRGPAIFAANHQSHLDTPAILWALPPRWRYRIAPAMAKEFFKAHFFPDQHTRRQRFTSSLNYYLASLFFNAFPLPQREVGARQTLRYAGELLSQGYSILIFPEGRRTMAGEIDAFLPGVGMMGARLDVPVVPVRLHGLDRVLHQKARMATPGPVRVAFGAPMRLEGENYAELARQVEQRVRDL